MDVKRIPCWDRVPAISDEELNKLIAPLKPVEKPTYKMFPIINSRPYQSIPWDMLTPHEAQAERNHGGQTLKRLAERGGLSWAEALAVLTDKKWDNSIHNELQAEHLVKRLVEEFIKGGMKDD